MLSTILTIKDNYLLPTLYSNGYYTFRTRGKLNGKNTHYIASEKTNKLLEQRIVMHNI